MSTQSAALDKKVQNVHKDEANLGIRPAAPAHLASALPTRGISSQSRDASKLDLSIAKPITNALPQGQAAASLVGTKRPYPYEVIDLSSDDDVPEPKSKEEASPPEKKSRSSSSSSDKSTKASQPVVLDKQGSQQPLPHQNNGTHPDASQATYRIPLGRFSQPPAFKRPLLKAPRVVIRPPKPPPTLQEIGQRVRFEAQLSCVKGLSFRNDEDNTSPPETFRFITEHLLAPGVVRIDEAFMIGCTCRKKRGASLECMYPKTCECVQDSGMDDPNFQKRHAYHSLDDRRGCLVSLYLKSRFHIFECNSKCDCSMGCKNRVVQFGRQVKLELFKTRDRGFGLRTMERLKAGQFVDTYRGEVITQAESERRSASFRHEEATYLFAFDKFVTPSATSADDNEEASAQEQPLYVCDGRNYGGPTRFMNHSCAPNCRLFTVSYNHADTNIYDLAFFAKEEIAAGTELTFDYLDLDEGDGMVFTEEMAQKHEEEKGYRPSECRCGSAQCRKYFFFLKE